MPVDDWLRGERLQTLMKVLPDSAGIRAWFQPDAVRALLSAQQRGAKYSSALWALLNFAVWHRIHIESDAEKPADQLDPLTLLA